MACAVGVSILPAGVYIQPSLIFIAPQGILSRSSQFATGLHSCTMAPDSRHVMDLIGQHATTHLSTDCIDSLYT